MQTFFIDPEGQSITPFKWGETRAELEAALGCVGLDFVRFNQENDRLALSDRGKIDGCVHGYFTIRGYPGLLAGRAVLFGVDTIGENRDPTVGLDWLQQNVKFHGLFLSGMGSEEVQHERGVEVRPRQPASLLTPEVLANMEWAGRSCEEASMFSRARYVPCGIEAVALVKTRDARPYFMCAGCMYHNVRNRGPGVEVLAQKKDGPVAYKVPEDDRSQRT